ncbi:MAG: ATP-binding protein [Verrucomicrobia bacterium]|nr:ATP-binding protein [Verrucomicrobiota bacterium]
MTIIGYYPNIANMWIQRDLLKFLQNHSRQTLPIKILRGPRQVGKTSLLHHLSTHKLILFDDLTIRNLAQENPALFFEQFTGPLILDEATLAPQIFPELKKRVDIERRRRQEKETPIPLDIWITGSNQTLLQKEVQESLAGRANYFLLNTLSMHEWENSFSQPAPLRTMFMRGGWPELHASPELNAVHYLNDFIATFIEKDIVSAAGIEKKAAFSKVLQLAAARIAQLLNYSDIAKNVGVDTTTVQSWISLLDQNGIIRILQPYHTNINQRLIKTPKIYLEDTGLAVRLQGWSEFEPLLLSPYFGHLLENLALAEITRFFINRGMQPQIYFVRSKEQVEVDFLIQLSNQRFIAIEAKTTPVDLSSAQMTLLDSLKLNIVERWIVSSTGSVDFTNARLILINQIFRNLERLEP